MQQAVYNQAKLKGQMRNKAQEEIENYFAAIRLKSTINGTTQGGKAEKRGS